MSVYFFKQKTANEMRISDWSSDVFSSDLSSPPEEPSMTNAAPTTSTIIPCLRYRDALAAIDWLCRAFGFEKHAVYADGDTVHHAQLTFGNGMVIDRKSTRLNSSH